MPSGISYVDESLLAFEVEEWSIHIPENNVIKQCLGWLYALLFEPCVQALRLLRRVAGPTDGNQIASLRLTPVADWAQVVIAGRWLSTVRATPTEVFLQEGALAVVGFRMLLTALRCPLLAPFPKSRASRIAVTGIGVPARSAFPSPHGRLCKPRLTATAPSLASFRHFAALSFRRSGCLAHIGTIFAVAVVSHWMSGIAMKARDWLPRVTSRTQVMARITQALVLLVRNARMACRLFEPSCSRSRHSIPLRCLFTIQYNRKERPCQTSLT